MFNPHRNVTSDGVLIVPGLIVWTNEVEVGRVQSDNENREFGCCQPTDYAGSEDNSFDEVFGRGELSDEQVQHLLRKGQIYMRDSDAWFRNPNFTPADGCTCSCMHDHWFTVSTRVGTKSFNGERLGTVMRGMGTAEAEWNKQHNQRPLYSTVRSF